MSNPNDEKRLLGHYFQTGNTEYRGAALQKDIDVSGGFAVVPMAIHQEIMHALDNQVFIRKLAKIFKVDKADSVGVPIMDDDISDPDWLSEISEASLDGSMDFEQRRLSPTRLAKAIKVSRDLLHLSTPDMADFVISRGVYKLAVAMENAFLNGNGVNRPLGLFTTSAHGINTDRDVSDGNDATSIKTDGLINALYSLKAQYIQSPACRWIFHRDAIKQVRKLKDGEGNYLWSPSIANDRPATILGVPYVVSEYCPNTFTSGSYVGLVGDMRFYGVAEWNETQVLTLNEKYALENAVGYVFQAHCDGMPLISEAFARVTLA